MYVIRVWKRVNLTNNFETISESDFFKLVLNHDFISKTPVLFTLLFFFLGCATMRILARVVWDNRVLLLKASVEIYIQFYLHCFQDNALIKMKCEDVLKSACSDCKFLHKLKQITFLNLAILKATSSIR